MAFLSKTKDFFIPILSVLLATISHSDGVCRHLSINSILTGKVLVNHTVDRIQPIERALCSSKCYLEPLCFSYNFCQDHINGSLCELLDSDDIRHGEHLVEKAGCTYYGSETSCSSNPCANNATCQGDFSAKEKPYRCVCPRGFTGQNCEIDIDECLTGVHQCHVNATCTNTIGGHNCTCKVGFHGNGMICEDIDECLKGTHQCHVNATCTNTIGGHDCTCKVGFHGNGMICEDIDECAENLHDCHAKATCQNVVDGYYCFCNAYLLGNGTFCRSPKSCEELEPFLPDNATSGLYDYELEGGGVASVFCSFESYSECGGGPWTLAMKIDGSKENLKYDSDHWTQKSVFNPDGSVGGLDGEETVSPAYWTTPLTKLCLGMRYGNALNWILINYTASSLHDIMTIQGEVPTQLGEEKWRSLLPQTSLQPNCNKEGFNLICERSDKRTRLRMGYFTNDQQDCATCNSYVGLGSTRKPVCGNFGTHIELDNGQVNIPAFCYILIQ